MSAMSSLPVLWGQMFLPGIPEAYRKFVGWLYVYGEPMATIYGTNWTDALMGGLITWVKVISLFCLLGWVVSWLSTALKDRTVARGDWLDIAALAASIGGVGTMLIRVMESTHRIPIYKIAGVYTVSLLTGLCLVIFFLWVEKAIWSTHGQIFTAWERYFTSC